MNKLLSIAIAAFVIHVVLFAQSTTDVKGLHIKAHSMAGYLVDYTCGKGMVMIDIKKSDAKAAKHTKDCALDEACSAKGYGLVAGGKFYKFDGSGDMKAKEYLKATTKKDNINVEIIGTMDDGKLAVESIKDLQSAGKKVGKKK